MKAIVTIKGGCFRNQLLFTVDVAHQFADAVRFGTEPSAFVDLHKFRDSDGMLYAILIEVDSAYQVTRLTKCGANNFGGEQI